MRTSDRGGPGRRRREGWRGGEHRGQDERQGSMEGSHGRLTESQWSFRSPSWVGSGACEVVAVVVDGVGAVAEARGAGFVGDPG